MALPVRPADLLRVRAPSLIALLAGPLAAAALVGTPSTAGAGSGCPAGEGGYAYAGFQANDRGHGVRATITLTRAPSVAAGHVAGWVGAGGPGQGADGEDAWIQAGVAAVPGTKPFLYAEVTRAGRPPRFVLLREGVAVGRGVRLAVLETSGRAGWWRVWVDGRPVTAPLRLRGSSGRWAPIATAETWSGGTATCSSFGFRFERVSVSHARGGSWAPFAAGHRFLDRGYRLRELAAVPSRPRADRMLAGRAVLPFAFLASSG